MLISPATTHSLLADLLTPSGVHTAMLVTPAGQLVCQATLDDGYGADADGDDAAEASGSNGLAGDGSGELGTATGAGVGAGVNGEADGEGDDGEGEDEPYVEPQQRLRILMGLAAQWEPGVPPKQECELGRLLFHSAPLPEPETAPAGVMLPSVRPQIPRALVLVLNGGAATAWPVFAAQAEVFDGRWLK